MYGAGSFANSCRIPNLQGIDGVRIVAVCDVDRQAREATAQRFAIPRAYADAGRMLAAEKIDVLYSLVRAADRTDVEARAAAQAGGATMTMTLVDGIGTAPPDNWFTVLYEGGHLALHGYDHIERDGVTVFRGEPFDPWAAQDRAFIEAVRTGDPSLVRSDYRDGLSTLAPVLAGWESARRGGACIDMAAYSDEE